MTHENFPHAVFSIHGRTITAGRSRQRERIMWSWLPTQIGLSLCTLQLLATVLTDSARHRLERPVLAREITCEGGGPWTHRILKKLPTDGFDIGVHARMTGQHSANQPSHSKLASYAHKIILCMCFLDRIKRSLIIRGFNFRGPPRPIYLVRPVLCHNDFC